MAVEVEHIEFVANAQLGHMRGGPLHDYKVIGADLQPPQEEGKPRLLVLTLQRGALADAIATVSVSLDIRDVLKASAGLVDKKARGVFR